MASIGRRDPSTLETMAEPHSHKRHSASTVDIDGTVAPFKRLKLEVRFSCVAAKNSLLLHSFKESRKFLLPTPNMLRRLPPSLSLSLSLCVCVCVCVCGGSAWGMVPKEGKRDRVLFPFATDLSMEDARGTVGVTLA